LSRHASYSKGSEGSPKLSRESSTMQDLEERELLEKKRSIEKNYCTPHVMPGNASTRTAGR